MENGVGLELNLLLVTIKLRLSSFLLEGSNFASSKSFKLFCLIICCKIFTYC